MAYMGLAYLGMERQPSLADAIRHNAQNAVHQCTVLACVTFNLLRHLQVMIHRVLVQQTGCCSPVRGPRLCRGCSKPSKSRKNNAQRRLDTTPKPCSPAHGPRLHRSCCTKLFHGSLMIERQRIVVHRTKVDDATTDNASSTAVILQAK